VLHRREVIYRPAARLVTVTDEIRCAAPHHIEIFWHFANECRLSLNADSATATREGAALALNWPEPLTARVLRGSDDPPQGWVSPRFDTKVPADTLIVSGSISGVWRGVSTLQVS
jgi:hypothetical protein